MIRISGPGKRQRALAGNVADVNAVYHIVKHIDQLGGYCGQGKLEQQSSDGPGG